MKNILSSTLFSVLLSTAFAQQNLCGTMDVLHKYLAEHPERNEQYLQYLEQCKQEETEFALYGSSARALSDTVYIPVVFHIIHNGDPIGTASSENISDAQILSQIEALNENFGLRNENAANIPDEFKALSASTKIRFCLAQFDENGNPTTGITRHNLGQVDWDQDAIENQVKPATIWNRSKYLNVWTARFGGSLASDGVLAYAQFPLWGSASTDGVIARYNVVGKTGVVMSSYNKGKTLVHEIGHWLGLFHIWGDDNGSCSGSDNVSDTPNQADQYFGCPSHPQVSCGGNNMFMNHMDYTDDDCRSMFTLGQESRMMNVLNTSRQSLKTGGLARCYYNTDATIAEVAHPDSSLCTGSFSPLLYVKNIGQTDISVLQFAYGTDGNYNSYTWTGSIPALTNAYITFPAISTVSGSHTFNAFIQEVNNAPDNNLLNDTAQTVTFSVGDEFVAFSIPYTEDFESGFFPPSDWSILNPSNDAVKWQDISTVGGYDQSSYSIWINNSAYTANPNKKRDAFVLPNFDFTTVQQPNLAFQYAYVNRTSRNDTLELSYSLNCGATWTKFWRNGGAGLVTSASGEIPFIPIYDEWDSVTVSLPQLAAQNNVLFKFENITGWGNALYIDNINLRDAKVYSGINETKASKVEVLLFPNPASHTVTVKLPENHPFTEIQISDALGRKVSSQKILDPISFVNVNGLTEGVYMIILRSNSLTQTEKLVVAK